MILMVPGNRRAIKGSRVSFDKIETEVRHQKNSCNEALA